METALSNMSYSDENTVNHTNLTSSDDLPSLPLWSITSYLCIVTFVTVISTTGNGVILAVECYNKRNTSSDWIVSFMANFDFASSIIDFSSAIVYKFIDDLGSALCTALFVINLLSTYTRFVSILLLFTIGVERYFKTCRPHSNAFSPIMTIRICIGITLGSSLVVVPFLLEWERRSNTQLCNLITLYKTTTMRILTAMIGSNHINMFALLIVMYTKIGFVMRKRLNRVTVINVQGLGSARNDNTLEMNDLPTGTAMVDRTRRIAWITAGQYVNNRHDRSLQKHTNRITFIMCLLTTVLIVTWSPVIAAGLMFANRGPPMSIKEYVLILFIRFLPSVNTISNPVFYVIMSSKFRQQSKVVLLKIYQSMKQPCHNVD